MRTSWRHSLSALFKVVAVAAFAIVLSGCGNTATEEITVAGSTTVLPIAEIAAEKYQNQGGCRVLVSGLGSSAGIEAAITGTAEIASSSRDLTPQEATYDLVKTPVAHDGIAVIVNEDCKVNKLTLAQLRGIYEGSITNWKQLGGEDLPILVVNRDEASGTREAFRNIVMGDALFDRAAAVLPGTGQVRDVVSRTKGAIGYISIGFVDTPFATTKVKALTIDGVKPNEETVKNGTYPISRDLFFFTKGEPKGQARSFIKFILSDEMNETIEEAGYIPIDVNELGGVK